MIRLEVIGADASASHIETARVLMREYAALPHVCGRWDTIDADIAALPEPFTAPQGALLIAWQDDEPLACVGLSALEPSIGEVKRMYVRPAARRPGVGAALLKALLEALLD